MAMPLPRELGSATLDVGESAKDSDQVFSVSTLPDVSWCFILTSMISRLAPRSYRVGSWVR
jgi:hypothetical protein